MEHPSEPRKPEHTPDNETLHELLQRLNNKHGDGSPVTPLPSQALLQTPDHLNNTTLSDGGVSPQPDPMPPPTEIQTILHKDGYDNTPQTTSSDNVVPPQPNPVIPPMGTQTIPDRDGHDTTPQTAPNGTVVSSEPDPVIPSTGQHPERKAQDILGGYCPLLPLQFCLVWAARKEKEISPLALKIYFASHETKYWRAHVEPGDTYRYEPYGFQPLDVGRLLPGVSAGQITRAFAELAAANILTVTPQGVWFAKSLEDVTLPERVTRRATSMFEQLHPDTREKIVSIPRRLLKLLVQCGRRLVRAATIIGILLTTMLVKRTDRYKGYKGCCKAEWIAKLFGVNVSRVKSERQQLIHEGWFLREPTTPRARKKFGQWVRLNLKPSEPPPEPGETPAEPTPEAVENPAPDVSKVQPQNPALDAEVQPLLNPPSPPKGIGINQTLTSGEPKDGASQPPQDLKTPTWDNIILQDLTNDDRSMALFQQAVDRGFLTSTTHDQVEFFTAIAHTTCVAMTNPGGFLRVIVEQGLWHHLTNTEEDAALKRLNRYLASHTDNTPTLESLCMVHTINGAGQIHPQPMTLSEDAFRVQGLNEVLDRAGCKGDIFRTVKLHGYLPDWDKKRWEQAERELAEAHDLLARQRSQAMDMTSLEDMIGEDIYEDDEPLDWG